MDIDKLKWFNNQGHSDEGNVDWKCCSKFQVLVTLHNKLEIIGFRVQTHAWPPDVALPLLRVN